ncbi:hypothetical protein QMZ93_10135 [Pantoea stewartii subsp. indologenes]|uniref:hypothetical protein n=1 Tax=Pantoea stewartii TaxID=66269 RepID=UPI00197DF643|nr:hypothetical protein [Pantoea stewartii]MDK2633692.1 hypothetical protein [Pantoea stewartii subsp. indologenes]
MITVRNEILKKGHIGYKVAPYEQLDHNSVLHESFSSKKEWSGFYVATTRQVAHGYRYDHPHAYGHTVTLLRNLPVLVFTGNELSDTSVSNTDKARMIKDALPANLKTYMMNQNKPLIAALGALGFCYQGPHDSEGGVEIIIPNNLIAYVSTEMKVDFGRRPF